MEREKLSRILTLAILVLLLAVLGTIAGLTLARAADITEADYKTIIRVTNNSTSPATGDVCVVWLSTADMITYGMLGANATDAAMLTGAGGTSAEFSPSVNSTYPWAFYMDSLAAKSLTYRYLWSKGATGGAYRMFLAEEGMYVEDDADLELTSANFSLEGKGLMNTDNGTDKNLVYKPGTYRVYFSDDEEITGAILQAGAGASVTLTTNGAGDLTDGDYIKNGKATQWECVEVSDADTSYIETPNSFAEQTSTYGLTSIPLGASEIWSINTVDVRITWKTTVNGQTVGITPGLRLAGVNETETRVDDDSSSYQTTTTTIDRPGGGSWTYGDLADLQVYVGGTGRDDGADLFITRADVVVHYTLIDEAASVVATGVGSGVHPWKLTGQENGYATYNGTNQYTALPAINYSNSFTIEAWVNVEDLSSARQIFGGSSFIAFWINTTGYIQINVGDGAWGTAFNSDAGEVVVDTWYHVVATYNGTATDLYKNGVHKGGAPNTKTVGNRTLGIGIDRPGLTNDMVGSIDEVRVYNRALLQTEITANYALGMQGSPQPSNPAGLLCWLPFNEGAGVAQDKTVNNNDGTLSGGATWVIDNQLTIYIDDVEKETSGTGNVTSPDNSENIVFGSSPAMLFMETASITIGGVLQGSWAWGYEDTLTDLSGNGHTGYPSYVTTGTNSDLVVEIVAQESAFTQSTATANISGGWTMVEALPAEPSGLFDEGGAGFPGGAEIKKMAETDGQDAAIWLFAVAYLSALAAMMAVYRVTASPIRNRRGSLPLGLAAALGVMTFFWLTTTIPGWTLVPVGLMGFFVLAWHKSPSPVD